MEIFDNFGLNRMGNRPGGTDHWINDILARMKSLSKSKFVMRLQGELVNNQLIFRIVNKQNKTYATLAKKGDSIALAYGHQKLPDPEHYIRPPFVTDADVLITRQGVAGRCETAELLWKFLDQENPYSEKSVAKVKVTPTRKPVEPWSFYGGQITDISYIPGYMLVEVENGKCSYQISQDDIGEQVISVRKCIIFNEKRQFECIPSAEFDSFFKMVDA